MALYECHITIEPVFDERLLQAKKITEDYFFRVADLLMQKRPQDTPERSKFDTFMTGHSSDFQGMQTRMKNCIIKLQRCGFKVYRYKIEEILLDSKTADSLNLLEQNPK